MQRFARGPCGAGLALATPPPGGVSLPVGLSLCIPALSCQAWMTVSRGAVGGATRWTHVKGVAGGRPWGGAAQLQRYALGWLTWRPPQALSIALLTPTLQTC